jgi:hypothetical protein
LKLKQMFSWFLLQRSMKLTRDIVSHIGSNQTNEGRPSNQKEKFKSKEKLYQRRNSNQG